MRDVVCFGEILWEVRPTGRQPGGAPGNVAVHLHQLGQPVQLVSRVGDDELGHELLAFWAAKGLGTRHVQQGATQLTGVGKAVAAYPPTYSFAQPVAWDYIQYSDELAELVAGAAALVYGTLVARQAGSRETLYRLLERARCRVFDVNLRAPHYTRETIRYLLGKADLVKLNHHELARLLEWYGPGMLPDQPAALCWLAERFGLQAACLTSGAEGALLYTGGHCYWAPGVPVAVRDPCGSGDAFLAALLRGWLRGDAPAELLRFACAAAALVAAHPGATPLFGEPQVWALLAGPAAAS